MDYLDKKELLEQKIEKIKFLYKKTVLEIMDKNIQYDQNKRKYFNSNSIKTIIKYIQYSIVFLIIYCLLIDLFDYFVTA